MRSRVAPRPVEPSPTRWALPPPERADPEGLVGVGADLEAGTLLAAYRAGLFPMPLGLDGPLGWWSPDPRGVLPLDGLRVSRSLRRSCARFEIRLDTAFDEVVAACAGAERQGRWITPAIAAAYAELHQLGWAHSIEAWAPGGELAGGLYGVRVEGMFAGESMFHRATDASKVALVGLVSWLREEGVTLLDVQWTTPHLVSLGAVDVPRSAYLAALRQALGSPA